MRLSDAGLTLADVDLGGIDAESDYKLDEDFVTTSYVESALHGQRALFLGRKGSGKSALFRQFPRLVVETGRKDTLVILLTPDQYAWAALKQYKELGLLPEQAHTNAWKLTLAIEIAGNLVDLDRNWSRDAGEPVARLRSFLSENFGQYKPGLTSTAHSLLKGLTSFNLSAFGFGVGAERNTSEQPLTPALIEALLTTLEAPLREQEAIIELDRLDDSWDGSAEAQTLLIGLLKAGKDINDRFRGMPRGTGLRVLTFLRSDIYAVLRFDDKDKHRATEEHIIWSAADLHEMLDRRLPSAVSPDELFEEGEMRGRIKPISYIIKRTFLRPREVLQFVDECIRRAGGQATEISKEEIRLAEDQYSAWKVDDLKQEFSRVSPDFGELLEGLRQEVHRYDSMEQLTELLSRKAPAVMRRLGERVVLQMLFDASVIGIRLGDAGSTRFKAEDPELALPATGAVYVHQSLYKGLNVREARRTEQPSEEDEAIAAIR